MPDETTNTETPPEKTPERSVAERIAASWPVDPLDAGWGLDEASAEEPKPEEDYFGAQALGALGTANDLNRQLLDQQRLERGAWQAGQADQLADAAYEAALEAYDEGAEPHELVQELLGVSPDAAARLLQVWQEDELEEAEPPTANEYLASLAQQYQAQAQAIEMQRQAEVEAKQARTFDEAQAAKFKAADAEVERLLKDHRDATSLLPLVNSLGEAIFNSASPEEAKQVVRFAHRVGREADGAVRRAIAKTQLEEEVWNDPSTRPGWLEEAPRQFDREAVYQGHLARELNPEAVEARPFVASREEQVKAARAMLEPDERERRFDEGWAAFENIDLHARRAEDERRITGRARRK
jgi:hypothetical protein